MSVIGTPRLSNSTHLPKDALQHFVNTHGPSLPKEFQPHSQVVDLLRNSTPDQHRQDALADFIKESNKARRKDKHVPKFSSVKEEDMQKIQSFCANGNTDAIHALMRKKRWKTLTLILGDEVVTLCRPKSKTGVMRYVRNLVDKNQDDKDTHSGQLLKLDAPTLGTLADQLMQQSNTEGVANGTEENAQGKDSGSLTQVVENFYQNILTAENSSTAAKETSKHSKIMSEVIAKADPQNLLKIKEEMEKLIGELEATRQQAFDKLPDDLKKQIIGLNQQTAQTGGLRIIDLPQPTDQHYPDFNTWERLEENLIPTLRRAIDDINKRLQAPTAAPDNSVS